MQVKLSGPGVNDLMSSLQLLLTAATEACQAYCMKSVKEMKQEDFNLQNLHQRKQKLESDVKRLEERKKMLTQGSQPSQAQPQQKNEMKKGTKTLTPEEQAAHRTRIEAERAARKAESEAKREAPLTHQPFAALADIEAKQEVQQS